MHLHLRLQDEHVEAFFVGMKGQEDLLFKYFPPGPYHSVEEYQTEFLHKHIFAEPARTLYAVFDKTGESRATPRSYQSLAHADYTHSLQATSFEWQA